MNEITEVIISGLSSGSAYAMMAVGMSLVYGVSKVFNFAYGSFYTMGGYLAWIFLGGLLGSSIGYPATFAIVITALFFIGMGTEKFAIRPLRARRDWEMLAVMSTLGLALCLDNLYLALFGPFRKSIPPLFEGSVHIAGTTVAMQNVAIAAIALSVIAGLWFFLNRTKQGLAVQAVAQDMTGAQIVGIDKDKVFAYTFALACVLVGFGGMLLAPKYLVSHLAGWNVLVKAWVITAFGGMGSVTGAVYAAFILGMVEAFVGWQLGLTWTLLVLFAILIGIFIVRPQGLRGTWG